MIDNLSEVLDGPPKAVGGEFALQRGPGAGVALDEHCSNLNANDVNTVDRSPTRGGEQFHANSAMRGDMAAHDKWGDDTDYGRDGGVVGGKAKFHGDAVMGA